MIWTFPDGSVILDHLRQQATGATITIVLIGPATRFSHWVDQEIEVSTKPTKSGPGAGLVGVILPHHEDYSKPYYDPEHVPLRLHDRILAEYAILRKWTDDPSEIARWLTETDRRRCQYDPTPSVRALMDLRRFPWSEPEDFGPEVSSRLPTPPWSTPHFKFLSFIMSRTGSPNTLTF
jgi:MTH538 TIR-like domain (DUF1863)